MEQVIYKYPISTGQFSIDLPKGAKILTVQNQNESVFIWAIVTPGRETQTRKFVLLGTGHPRNDIDTLLYRGTFQLDGGAFVGHLFETE